jgi:hypothetical protein
VVVPEAHEFLDEAFRHGIGRVLAAHDADAIQFKGIFKIKFVFGHMKNWIGGVSE